MTATMNAFELEREQRIATNKRKMEEMGILKAKEELDTLVAASQPAPKRQVRKPRETVPESELRRSTRDRVTVNYCEEIKRFNERLPGVKAERRVVYIHREELDPSLLASPKVRSNVDSGKGVRIQGGRVYDSKLGVTCHWCRQKTLENKVTCTAPQCGGGRRLPTSFCRMCLKNRHGEDVDEAEASGKWVCPCCRVSCGAGCSLCCNCGPCRKKAGQAPTHQIIKEARLSGFDNVHDFLIHQATGESAEAISSRKLAAAWGSWLVLGTESEEVAPENDVSAAENEEPEPRQKRAAEKKKPATAVDDQFTVVKVVPTHTGTESVEIGKATARKRERKLRALRFIGLAAPAGA